MTPGLMIFFAAIFGSVALIAILAGVLSRKREKKITSMLGTFQDVAKAGALKAVPETAGFDLVMGQGTKDVVAAAKGYDRLSTGYSSMPSFIVSYRGDEMYIMAVEYPSRKEMEVDPNFILHITKDNLESVKFGTMGKVMFFFKGTKKFFAMTVTDFAISMIQQPLEHKQFKKYIKEFAERVNQG